LRAGRPKKPARGIVVRRVVAVATVAVAEIAVAVAAEIAVVATAARIFINQPNALGISPGAFLFPRQHFTNFCVLVINP
jgi:hypothetical protein